MSHPWARPASPRPRGGTPPPPLGAARHRARPAVHRRSDMPRKTVSLGILLSGLAAVAAAQPAERSGPPPVLSIEREQIKPGRMAAHEKVNVGYVSALAKTSSQSYWLGLVP